MATTAATIAATNAIFISFPKKPLFFVSSVLSAIVASSSRGGPGWT
jgi:hypothetical protein